MRSRSEKLFSPDGSRENRGVEVQSRAQRLRRTETPAEKKMWKLLRDRQMANLKFRRQSPISIYVVDFYCHALKLVVELDGDVHSSPRQAAHDDNRDWYLRSLGHTILRFSNEAVFEKPEWVLRRILETAEELRRRNE
jgi:type I restriction enzyme, R subunit